MNVHFQSPMPKPPNTFAAKGTAPASTGLQGQQSTPPFPAPFISPYYQNRPSYFQPFFSLPPHSCYISLRMHSYSQFSYVDYPLSLSNIQRTTITPKDNNLESFCNRLNIQLKINCLLIPNVSIEELKENFSKINNFSEALLDLLVNLIVKGVYEKGLNANEILSICHNAKDLTINSLLKELADHHTNIAILKQTAIDIDIIKDLQGASPDTPLNSPLEMSDRVKLIYFLGRNARAIVNACFKTIRGEKGGYYDITELLNYIGNPTRSLDPDLFPEGFDVNPKNPNTPLSKSEILNKFIIPKLYQWAHKRFTKDSFKTIRENMEPFWKDLEKSTKRKRLEYQKSPSK